ncbi:AMP-binding protein [Actinomadura viridis]|uniref:AMP-binding protein n=1 Tax=Actinomadura viridis TaxID=58110 RepID=UPI0036C319AA
MFDGNSGRLAVPDTTVTKTVLEAARRHAVRDGDRPALIGSGRRIGFARFVDIVPAAAVGLARRGVRLGDVGAIQVADACDTALAVHAVTAAGAVAAPLPAGLPAGELARLMDECGARFLMTGAGAEAGPALAATGRSRVRQVFAFGDLPGATPFARLAGGPEGTGHEGTGPPPLVEVSVDPLRDPALHLHDPPEDLTHADRLADLFRLGGAAGVVEGDVLACCAADCSVPTWLGLMDLCLTQGATFAGVPDADPAALLAAVDAHGATLAVVTPEKLRALAYGGEGAARRTEVRLLVTGTSEPEVVRACRQRHGWPVTFLI